MKPATALVRAARPEDARSVAEVHVASWRHAYRGLLPDDYLERLSVDDREAMWLGSFGDPDPKSGAVVAEVDDRIVGSDRALEGRGSSLARPTTSPRIRQGQAIHPVSV
jgi:hypothetical protein